MQAAPTVHGIYDFWLGGSQHMRADRELATAVAAEFPTVPARVRAAKEFHLRAARWCAERGISRFIRAGAVTWVPEGRNLHEAVPRAQVVYATRDAEAHQWALHQLACPPRVTAVQARVSDPAGLLAAPPVKAMTAEGEPVALVIGMVLHCAAGTDAAAHVEAYARALPAGSVIAVSLAVPGRSARAGKLMSMLGAAAPVYRHSPADVLGWLQGAGLEVVPPGVADVRSLLLPGCRGEWAGQVKAASPGTVVGALAVKR